MQIFLLSIIFVLICVLVYQGREIRNLERKIKMELVLLTVSICCVVWGIYNYSEVQKLGFKAEKTFMEMEKTWNLKNELKGVKK